MKNSVNYNFFMPLEMKENLATIANQYHLPIAQVVRGALQKTITAFQEKEKTNG